jgi:hypothetical protein
MVVKLGGFRHWFSRREQALTEEAMVSRRVAISSKMTEKLEKVRLRRWIKGGGEENGGDMKGQSFRHWFSRRERALTEEAMVRHRDEMFCDWEWKERKRRKEAERQRRQMEEKVSGPKI